MTYLAYILNSFLSLKGSLKMTYRSKGLCATFLEILLMINASLK